MQRSEPVRSNNLLLNLPATRWGKYMSSGRTAPALIGCDCLGGTEIECIVKLNGANGYRPIGPVSEVMAALLARDLMVNVPQPYIVEIGIDFVNSIIDAKAQKICRLSQGLNFSTQYLGNGWSALPRGQNLKKEMLVQMAAILAFDTLIQNPDRRLTNPNCLSKGDEFAIFDHDCAFAFLASVIDEADLEKSYAFIKDHVFAAQLRFNRVRFEIFADFLKKFDEIQDSRFQDYVDSVPDAWPEKNDYAERIRDHLVTAKKRLPVVLEHVYKYCLK